MTSLNFEQLNSQAKQTLAITLAAFVLKDSKIPVNAENLKKALESSKNKVSDPIVHVFAHTLETTPLDKLLQVGGSASGSSQASAPASGKAPEAKVEAKKEAPKPVEEEVEVDMDMGDLFG